MRRVLYWAPFALTVAIGACTSPGAPPALRSTSEMTRCTGGPSISDEIQMAACTNIIQTEHEPDDRLAAAYRNRSRLLSRLSAYDAAIADSDRAVALTADAENYLARATAYFGRAGESRAAADYEHAIEDYDEALKRDPDRANVLFLRGWAYSGKGDYDRAIIDFMRAIDLDPNLSGMAGGELERSREAQARIAGGQKPGDQRAWCAGQALPGEGFTEDLQIEGCTTLIESRKENIADLAQDYFNRASAHDFTGDHERAIADYKMALGGYELSGTSVPAAIAVSYLRLGMIYYLKADYDAALAYLDQAAIANPEAVLPITYRGYLHHDNGQFDLAIADFDRVIELQPDSAEALLHRSMAFNGKRDYERALVDCNEAIRLSQTSEATEGHNSCGNAHFGQGNFKQAIDDYDLALKLWPEYPEALYGRGAAKIRIGDRIGGQADIDTARNLKADVEMGELKLNIVP